MITGHIIRQHLNLCDSHVVADTIDYLEAKFLFKTDDWDGLDKWAHFANDSAVYDIRLTEDCIRKEDHLNLSAGMWKVYLHGNEISEDGTVIQRITTDIAVLYVENTGILDGEPFPTVPPSAGEQIIASAQLAEAGAKESAGRAAASESSADKSAKDAALSEKTAAESRDAAEKFRDETGQIRDEVETSAENALDEIASAGRTAVSAVENAGETQVRDIANAGGSAVTVINQSRDGAVREIAAVQNSAVKQVNDTGAAQVQAVGAAGAEEINAVRNAGETAVGEVESAGNTALTDIEEAKNGAIDELRETPIPEETVKNAVDEYVAENGLNNTPIHLAAEQESAQLGEELISADGWTTAGWTGNFADGFTHTSGNTNPLIFTMPEATGTNLYQVSFVSSPTLETMRLFVTVGNSAQFDLYGQNMSKGVGIQSIEDGNLQFIPAETYTGTISNISIKRILSPFDGIKAVMDSGGYKAYEMRPTAARQENLFAGNNSGQFNTSGAGNLGFGSDALANNTSGFWNVGLGFRALKTNTVGTRNIGIGYGSLLRNVCGHRNIGIGSFSLVNNLTGNWNISIGADSQDHLVSGDNNTGVGFSVLYHNQTGSNNAAFGASALMGATNPLHCTAVGYQAGYSNSGERNTAIGAKALMNIVGERNTGLGYMAGYGAANATAKSNIFIGMQAGYKVTSAISNIMIGSSAGFNLTSGYTNIFIGNSTGNGVTSGADNILIGNGVDVDANLGKSKNLNIGNLIKGWLKSGEMYAIINGGLSLPSIPTTDPAIAGRVWNDKGTLKISTGAAA